MHFYRDVHVGATYVSHVTGSTIGAIAAGDHATATGTVHVGAAGSVTQAQHDENIKKAKKALVDDEGLLDELVHEALTQFLTLARKIQVEQQSLAETRAMVTATLNGVWAAQTAKGMRPQLLPETLEVVKVLVGNPVMGEIVNRLTGTRRIDE